MKPFADAEILAILYKPDPGSGLPPLKIERTLSPEPLSPCVLFKRGDPSALAALLRSDAPLTAEMRAFAAAVVDGSVKRPRGNKRVRGFSIRDVSMIREVAIAAKEKGITYKDVLCVLAEFYNRSESTMRDVIEHQHTYAEK